MNTVTVPVTRKKTVCTKTGQKHFIGIDMHKKFMQVAVMDSDGTVMPNEGIGCDKRIVKREFAKFPDDAKYVLESSSVWYGMYGFLRDRMNLDVVLSNPLVTKMIAASKKKTDRADARIPADLLRGGYIIECYIPDEETVGMRQPVRYGDRTVGERTRFGNPIRGILPRDGIETAGLPFSAEFIDGLHKLGNRRMEKHLGTVGFLDGDISDCNIRIQKEVPKRDIRDKSSSPAKGGLAKWGNCMKMRGVGPRISRHAVEMLVCGTPPVRRKKYNMRFKNGRWLQVVNKLDEDQVRWIVRENRSGTTGNKEIAGLLGVSVRWARKLCAKYRDVETSMIRYPERMGRPVVGLPGRREQSAVLSCHAGAGAVRLERIIGIRIGIHIPQPSPRVNYFWDSTKSLARINLYMSPI